MSILTGNNGVVKIDNASATPTAIAAVRNFSVEQTADTIENTHMATSGGARTYVKGLSSWSGSADIYFDAADLAAVAALSITSGAVGDPAITVELYLNGTAQKFSGDAIITGYTVNSSMDGMVEASISFQGSGVATFTA